MPAFINRRVLLLALVLLALGSVIWYRLGTTGAESGRTIALLVPDTYERATVGIWKQAASEEGVKLDVVTASSFLKRTSADQAHYAGIIVPDTIHKRANGSMTESLRQYVEAGGNMMVVFDAMTLDLNGAYPQTRSRLSAMTGVPYALFEQYGTATIGRAAVVSNRQNLSSIGITPGRFDTESMVPAALPAGEAPFDQWLTTYQYKELRYPFFRTGKAEPGARILMATSTGDVAASEHAYGRGRTLFVNLPLGFLKNSTDGLPLHAFLRYFSDEFVRLPRLLSSPQGIGGLILNIHVDNGAAIRSLDFLRDIGVFEQGPHSIHFTAGPDVNQAGDGQGMNVPKNATTQAWIRRFVANGDKVGNHGGWIHNYFGTGVREDNRSEFESYLELNNDAMSSVSGQAITEYSAPIGNQPLWVTKWLAAHGMVTYYTTSNLGMGPTRMFINDRLIDVSTWAIPITPFGRIASFEEAMFASQPAPPVTAWLKDLVAFVADNRNVREIYCHPIGVPYYAESMRALLEDARSLTAAGRFKWRTMTEIATFMSQREQVAWHIGLRQGQLQIDATHPTSLKDMAWQLPVDQCTMPAVQSGTAKISRDGALWRVVAEGGKALRLSCSPDLAPAPAKSAGTITRVPAPG